MQVRISIHILINSQSGGPRVRAMVSNLSGRLLLMNSEFDSHALYQNKATFIKLTSLLVEPLIFGLLFYI